MVPKLKEQTPDIPIIPVAFPAEKSARHTKQGLYILKIRVNPTGSSMSVGFPAIIV